ncbi:MAG: hypothetical protein SGI88_07645 [Candidatus Hydrogenedentes bacterium]|nr:hypothetical protein [Candidatus Hydrogenedentota bacterium]
MLETLVFTLVFGAAFLGMGLNFNLGADGLSWITLAWQPWHVVLWGLVVQIAVAIDFIKLWITRRKELVL